MNTIVALRGNFDSRFPDLNSIGPDEDRVPGRELATIVREGLTKQGLQTSEVQNEEPFFLVRCKSGDIHYDLLVHILYPDERQPVWVIECPPTLGFWDKLRKKSEDKELSSVLQAIAKSLANSDGRVRETRWFKKLPAEPFGTIRYARGPMVDA